MDNIKITGYGTYISPNRLPVEEVIHARHDENLEEKISKWDYFGVDYKSVPGKGEDTITISAMALKRALESSGVGKEGIKTAHLGTESPQYEVGNAAVHSAKLVGVGVVEPLSSTLTLENACNAWAGALVKSGADINLFSSIVNKILGKEEKGWKSVAIGADIAQAPKGGPLEKAAGAGGTAFILGNSKDPIAEIKEIAGCSEPIPDFFRREGQTTPNHYGTTTVLSYLQYVTKTIGRLLDKKPNLRVSDDIDHLAFHSPSGYMVRKEAKLLQGETVRVKLEGGVEEVTLERLLEKEDIRERIKINEEDYKTKIEPYLDVVKNVGNLYAGSTPTVIARIFDEGEPGDKILATSYGSGMGTKSFVIEMKDGMEGKRQEFPVKRQEDGKIINWKEYKELEEFNYHPTPPWKRASIEPLEGSETKEVSICGNCGLIYSPSLGSYFLRECLNPSCKNDQVRKEKLPQKARVKEIIEGSAPYEKSPDGVIVPIIGEVEPGETVEAVPRRIGDSEDLKDLEKKLEDCWEKLKDWKKGKLGVLSAFREVENTGRSGVLEHGWVYR